MKIAVVGSNLQAGVLTALLSEYGNELYVFPDNGVLEWQSAVGYQALQDPHLTARLNSLYALNEFTVVTESAALPFDIDCYILCYDPHRYDAAEAFVKALSRQSFIDKPLMINSGTFGLYGTDKLAQILPQGDWVYLPDTVQEGNAVGSFVKASKVIIGTKSMTAKVLVRELFRPLFPLEQQFLWMPILDAELAKMSISGMLATRISYMNDLANVAEKIGVDILNVRQGLAADSRIGSSYLSPGVGFGGENFSHDILMLSNLVSESGVRGRLLEQVWAINEDQKEILFRKLWRFFKSEIAGKKIAIWGASFKEETTSTYNSPIHAMIEALTAQGASIQLYDPKARAEIEAHYGSNALVTLYDNKYEALHDSDALCVLTAWKEFYSPNYDMMKKLMKFPMVLDGRNIYDPEFMKCQGFTYEGVGRA